jgi:hypothetical protein
MVESYRVKNIAEFMKLTSVPALFDMMGWLVRKGCCDVIAIDERVDWETHYDLWEKYIINLQGKADTQLLDDRPAAIYGNFVWLSRQ